MLLKKMMMTLTAVAGFLTSCGQEIPQQNEEVLIEEQQNLTDADIRENPASQNSISLEELQALVPPKRICNIDGTTNTCREEGFDYRELFDTLDSNQDGILTFGEARALFQASSTSSKIKVQNQVPNLPQSVSSRELGEDALDFPQSVSSRELGEDEDALDFPQSVSSRELGEVEDEDALDFPQSVSSDN